MESKERALKPSSATEGFFQQIPKLENQFQEDLVLRRTAELFLPPKQRASTFSALSAFASSVLEPQIFTWITDAESHSPTVTTANLFSHPEAVLTTSEGWRRLQEFGIKNGIWTDAYNRIGELGAQARVVQFLKYHIWSGSCAITTCPAAMADGAAALLGRHLASGELDGQRAKAFAEARRHLLSRNPADAWTSGQWMTERSGGSDVRGTETLATLSHSNVRGTDATGNELGPYAISGFKFFSSATDSQMTIMLARTSPTEISAFFAPLYLSRRADDRVARPNGVRIAKLKPKVGTRPLPTAELELKGMRAYMIGKPGQGTKELSAVLTTTRVHTALSALGFWGRGLAIARAYARVRKVAGGRLLTDVPAHVKALTSITVRYAANMALGFFTVACLGVSTSATPTTSTLSSGLVPSQEQATHLLRLLTPVAKSTVSTEACVGLRECMESLGGIGYLEDPATPELNVARLLRDCLVLPIWEGTSDVLGADVARVLASSSAPAVVRAFEDWVLRHLKLWKESKKAWMAEAADTVKRQWESWRDLVSGKERQEMEYFGRPVISRIAWIVSATVLVEDARRDDNPSATEIAKRWIAMRSDVYQPQSWKDAAVLDSQITFPELLPQTAAPKL